MGLGHDLSDGVRDPAFGWAWPVGWRDRFEAPYEDAYGLAQRAEALLDGGNLGKEAFCGISAIAEGAEDEAVG
jgi:hypothetical protein